MSTELSVIELDRALDRLRATGCSWPEAVKYARRKVPGLGLSPACTRPGVKRQADAGAGLFHVAPY
jgi:hypothetical protein